MTQAGSQDGSQDALRWGWWKNTQAGGHSLEAAAGLSGVYWVRVLNGKDKALHDGVLGQVVEGA